MMFLALLKVETLVAGFLWNDLSLPSRRRMQVVSEQLPHHRIECIIGGGWL